MYLPGLAACGVEFQDRYSNVSHPGLKDDEIKFLAKVPELMRSMLANELKIKVVNDMRSADIQSG